MGIRLDDQCGYCTLSFLKSTNACNVATSANGFPFCFFCFLQGEGAWSGHWPCSFYHWGWSFRRVFGLHLRSQTESIRLLSALSYCLWSLHGCRQVHWPRVHGIQCQLSYFNTIACLHLSRVCRFPHFRSCSTLERLVRCGGSWPETLLTRCCFRWMLPRMLGNCVYMFSSWT